MGKILKFHNMLIKKEISARELTLMYLNRLREKNHQLNAFVLITEKEALAAADKVDEKIKRGEDIHFLAGIPMTLKDNISTKGIRTTCCSKMLENYVPVYDATVWEKLNRLGAVHLGKTNMDEFAMGCTSKTSMFGLCVNPYSKDCVAGGSSSGGACAVGADMAVYALGSDTGGSVRQPASFCGAVGFKPTYGAISRYGLIAYASSLDQIGVIAESVMDTAIVFDAISGKDSRDNTSKSADTDVYKKIQNDIKDIKIGVPYELFESSSKEVKEKINQALLLLQKLSIKVEFFSMPVLKSALYTYFVISCAEAASNLGRFDSVRYGSRAKSYTSLEEMITKTRTECFGDEVKKRILLGSYVLSRDCNEDYFTLAQKVRLKIKQEFKNAFEKFDIVVTPTSPNTALEINPKETKVHSSVSDMCTSSVNLAGLPAVSVPCGFSFEGLPVGIQFIGNYFKEAQILNVAYKYEELLKNGDFLLQG